MSRIGKVPIQIPSNVTMTLVGDVVHVKGPKGELQQQLHPNVRLAIEGTAALVTVKNPEEKGDRSLWGLFRVLLTNMVRGVTEGFSKQLEIEGVGFKMQTQGRKVVLNVGFSHPVVFDLPDGIDAKLDGAILTITGIEKQLVGETAARIRAIKKPEPYKGKGIHYVGETIRRKAGKVVKGSTA